MDTISSRQNPVVRACRELADVPDQAGARLLLDGIHLVRDAHAAGYAFEFVAVASSRLARDTEEGRLARRLETIGSLVYTVTDMAFAAMSPVRSPSGIVAVAHRTPSDAASIYRHPESFVLVAVDVQDPGNLGALVRAAEAGGATGALVCGASAHPYSWKALRGSMGSALRLPTASVSDAEACVADLRAAGVRTIAASPRDGHDPDAVNWTGSIALVIGGEGTGLHDSVRAACDESVTIPMAAPVESLNVSVAAAILIYAARRQRTPPAAARGLPPPASTDARDASHRVAAPPPSDARGTT
jgi:TrmH family RNA methyltransferase